MNRIGTRSVDWCWQAASCFLLVMVAYLSLPPAASSQEVGQ